MKKFTLPSAGSLLLSDPFLIDPNFKRSVVLLCEHQGNGSVGFILSRPLNLKLKDAIPEIEEFDAPLYYGGRFKLIPCITFITLVTRSQEV